MEPHSEVTRGQTQCGIDRIPQENIPSLLALWEDHFSSELRHFWCPIGEVGDNQPRLPTSDIFKTIAPGLLSSSNSHQDRCHKSEWPVLQLTALQKKPKRPWGKVGSHPKFVGFDSSLPHSPGVLPIAEPSLPKIGGPALPSSLLSGCHGLFSRKLVFHFGLACFDPLLRPSHVRDRICRDVLPLEDPKTPKTEVNVFDPSKS